MHIIINKDKQFLNQLHQKLDSPNQLSNWTLFNLHYQVTKHYIQEDFESLLVPSYLPHIQFMEHQLKAAKSVIHEMDGRAILADEVGLGKTIEAGLILKEYMVRNLVQKVLILVPASLVSQWVEELQQKFHIPVTAYRRGYEWNQANIMIASIDTAKQKKHQPNILDIDYDMIIIDEAHKIKNHKTKNFDFIHKIHKKYCLLLTATPIQNNLRELFNLVTILKPGYLGTYQDFKDTYQSDQAIQSNRYLQKLMQQIMVRHTRKDHTDDTVERHVKTIWLTFDEASQAVYDSLTTVLQNNVTVSSITYLKELCSSREACYLSLKASESKAYEAIIEEISQLPHHIKAAKLVELIQSFGDQKVIVFTEYRATQFYLAWYLSQHNISSVPFSGGMKPGKKSWMQSLFQHERQVLIATEAGGEGINLQFCNIMINYDLPWNPLRLEQRIGRIHRYGQQQDMYIYHLAIQHTIEAHMMQVLYDKLDLFEDVVGKLDHLLSNMNHHDKQAYQSMITTLAEQPINLVEKAGKEA